LEHITLWKLLKPLYGLPEAGRNLSEPYGVFHDTELRMKRSETDACLFFHKETSGSTSAIVIQVDDSFGTGSPSFLDEEDIASFKFPSRGS
jgi:hypothetical protein